MTDLEATQMHQDYQQILSEDIEFKPKYDRACKTIIQKDEWISKLLKIITNLEEEKDSLKTKVEIIKMHRKDLLSQLQDYLDLEKERV